jgi:hypothetical protein
MYRNNNNTAREFGLIEEEASEAKVKAMLRDIAYVLHLTKKVKKEILDDLAGITTHDPRDLAKPRGLMNFSGGAA